MGAAASIPDELTQEEAIKLAGDKWDEKLLALWPAGADKITKDQLLAIIKDVPIFAKKSVDEKGNWDETAVNGQTKSIEEVIASTPDAVAPEGSLAKPAAAKVETATRDKHDMALRRAQKLAEQNNMTVEEVMAMQTQSSGGAASGGEPGEKTPAPKPPRAPGTKSKSRQQSEELRELMRAQRAAAKAEGRPMSRGAPEEVQLFVRPASRGGDGSAPAAETQVFVCDGKDEEPQVLVVGPETA